MKENLEKKIMEVLYEKNREYPYLVIERVVLKQKTKASYEALDSALNNLKEMELVTVFEGYNRKKKEAFITGARLNGEGYKFWKNTKTADIRSASRELGILLIIMGAIAISIGGAMSWLGFGINSFDFAIGGVMAGAGVLLNIVNK
jgi:hypothetical protein